MSRPRTRASRKPPLTSSTAQRLVSAACGGSLDPRFRRGATAAQAPAPRCHPRENRPCENPSLIFRGCHGEANFGRHASRSAMKKLPRLPPGRLSGPRSGGSGRGFGGSLDGVSENPQRPFASAGHGGVSAGDGVARGRIGRETELSVVDAILTGVHRPGESHYELLRAFASDAALDRLSAAVATHRYRDHEFGDSVLIERPACASLHRESGPEPGRSGRKGIPEAAHAPNAF